MSDLISFNPVRALDANGNPVAGARAFFYLSGTTEPATVFADPEETTPHPVPLEADAEGIFPPVYRAGRTLKVEVQTSGGDTLSGFPIDPVLTVPASGSAASQVSFEPTGEIPRTNVQAAIERVQENLVEPLLAGGIGVTGNAEILSNVDATDTASGFYRFTTDATGTLPSALDGQTGIIYLLRRTSADAWQFAGRSNSDRFFMRRLTDGSWQSWNEWTHQGVLVGTVSQSGGDPTGAVIERGSNSNGEYVRYADGTQMCWGLTELTYENNATMNSSGIFPISFSGTPRVIAQISGNLSNLSTNVTSLGASRTLSISSSGYRIQQFRISGGNTFEPGDTVDATWIATGRWF